MSKRIAGIILLVAMQWSIGAVCASAQRPDVLNQLAKGKGTIVANGVDKYQLTAVLVILKENGDAQLTLYSDIQVSAQGKWSKTKDPKVISFKITGGVGGDDSRIKGKLTLREGGTSVASLTAQGPGLSGSKYEINFVAEEKDPANLNHVPNLRRCSPVRACAQAL
jgi:hypothetical protein